jgi:hypothetical protein
MAASNSPARDGVATMAARSATEGKRMRSTFHWCKTVSGPRSGCCNLAPNPEGSVNPRSRARPAPHRDGNSKSLFSRHIPDARNRPRTETPRIVANSARAVPPAFGGKSPIPAAATTGLAKSLPSRVHLIAVGAVAGQVCMARVVFFAFDIAEAAQLRRIDSLRAWAMTWPPSRSGATTWTHRPIPTGRTSRSGGPATIATACGSCGLCGGRGGSGGTAPSSTAAASGSRAISTCCCWPSSRAAWSRGRCRGWSTNASTFTGCSPARTRSAPSCAGRNGGCWRAATS